MKELPVLLTLILSLVVLVACGAAREASAPDDMAIAERVSATLQQMTAETSVSVQAERRGKRIDYAIQGEVDGSRTLILAAWYDAEDAATCYDIVYLMHGWGGSAGEYFNIGTMKETFDNLMEKGDMKPSILVSATFYNENSNRDFSGSIAELRAFHNDFGNALMPAVEGKYHTYANSTSPEDLKASRDHRAFGGFSLGSVTAWMAFCYDYDYIRYFAPMSGSCWYYGTYGDFQTVRNVDFIENLVKEQHLDERGYFIYHAVGTLDSVKSQTLMQAEEMLARGNVFTPEHYVFYQKDGGYHDMNAVQEYLYNALPLFFSGGETATPVAASAPVTERTTVGEVKSLPAFDFITEHKS